jgi:RNA polymerase sigma-70 factor (ECF subfamily)
VEIQASEINLPASAGPAADRLFEAAYTELRRIASARFRGERSGHTLQPTALVNEAYLKLRRQNEFAWVDDQHFLAQVAIAMRQVLADFARKRNADKRDGQQVDWTLSGIPDTRYLNQDDFLALHQVLDRLALQLPNGARHARLVELVWLGGLDFTSVASVLGISRRQAHRDWNWARVWLQKELQDEH